MFKINLEVSCSLHNKSWWQPLVQRSASQGTLASKDLCLYEHCFSHQRRENTTGLQYAGHWTSRNHSRLYLSMVLMLFQARKTPLMHFAPPYTPCDVIATKMMPPSGRAHPHAYTVQVGSKSDWRFLRYWHFCTTPLPIFPIWPLSANTPETWPQNQHQHHNNSSPSLPRTQQMPLLACWQLGQHQSAYLSMTGTLKMHTTPSPYFAIPWRTGFSSTAYCLTVRTTSGMFLQP